MRHGIGRPDLVRGNMGGVGFRHYPMAAAPEQELLYLKEDLDYLRSQISATEERIAQLETVEDNG
jgi:hypothetical protein